MGGKRSSGPAFMAVCRGIGVMMMKIFALAARGGVPSAHCDGRNGELGRVPSGGDGRAHEVSHLNGRGLAGGTMSMRRMGPPQSGHGKAAPSAVVAGPSQALTFGSTGCPATAASR